MSQKRVSVVVLDLDNTLWDWVDAWYRSFSAMLEELVRSSGIPRDRLVAEIRAVHREHGTSEYAFLVEELESLRAGGSPETRPEVAHRAALEAFESARREATCLYPTVFETLWALRERGCLVVGYTESMAFYTSRRLREMGLDGLLDSLYSPADHDAPVGLTPEQARRYPADAYRLRKTLHRHTPPGELKPNPGVLAGILADVGARAEDAVYVGDSLMKDIAMARDAGVADVYAAYGDNRHGEAYELLRAVSHWTDADVEREQQIQQRGRVTPTHTLDHCLSQLLALFEFVPFTPAGAGPARPDLLGHQIDIWKKVVDVQQHFNDMEMRIRNYAITLLVAVLGAAALGIKEGISVPILGVRPPLGALVLAAGLVGWIAFYLMDRLWYHRLLHGAVVQGMEIENRLKPVLPEIALSDAIKTASPFTWFGTKVGSDEKMDIFYGSIAVLLVAMIVAAWSAETSSTPAPPEPERVNLHVDNWPPGARLVLPPPAAPATGPARPAGSDTAAGAGR